MVTQRVASQNFVSAFNSWLEDLTPNYLKSRKEAFKSLPSDSRDEKPITERIGKARLFDLDINKPTFIRRDWFGGSTQGVTIDYDLVIAYPKDSKWFHAMVDDFMLIKMSLEDEPVRCTGVSFSMAAETFDVIDTDDSWQYIKTQIRVLYDITKT